MAKKVILALPYYALKDVIAVICAGLDVSTISERTRNNLLQWCESESQFVSNVPRPETDEEITTGETVTFKHYSPCMDIYEIAREMSIGVRDVGDAQIEEYSRRIIPGREESMLNIACFSALWSASHELSKLLENHAPDPSGTKEGHFYHEYEGVEFLVTIEVEQLDAQLTVETVFRIGGWDYGNSNQSLEKHEHKDMVD